MILKLLLAGDGGQGIQLIADILARAAMENGVQVTSIPNYGLEQRGGVSLVYIKISDKEIVYPRFTCPDYLLILSDQARERAKRYQVDRVEVLDIKDFKEKLDTEKIRSQSYNVFFLGVLVKILVDKKVCQIMEVEKLLEKKLSKKLGWEENKKAFNFGVNL